MVITWGQYKTMSTFQINLFALLFVDMLMLLRILYLATNIS